MFINLLAADREKVGLGYSRRSHRENGVIVPRSAWRDGGYPGCQSWSWSNSQRKPIVKRWSVVISDGEVASLFHDRRQTVEKEIVVAVWKEEARPIVEGGRVI